MRAAREVRSARVAYEIAAIRTAAAARPDQPAAREIIEQIDAEARDRDELLPPAGSDE
jgi:hypothetical protein